MTDTSDAQGSGSSSTTWIDVPGGRLAADDHGPRDGSPIVLVHSAVVNRRAWDGVVPNLVEAGYRVIAYDMRGFGESTSEDVEFTGHEDVLAVLDHFELRHAAIVGNSMGAHFSLDALLAAPDRFVAYVWVAGGISGFDKDPSPAEEALFQAESDAEDAGEWDLAAELDAQIWIDGPGQPTTRAAPEVREAFKAMDRELLEPGRVFGKRRPAETPAIDQLGSVRVPMLVVVGDLDTEGTRASAERLAADVPAARLIRIPNVAHLIGMEVPDELAALIVEHLSLLPRWS
ncbi:MAG TPA: alpha/beta hydrolase [Candidatus Limnocylindria bacterium]|nr:alpha/beta hydrolase [Candidatus Limnocylindria bacterium]